MNLEQIIRIALGKFNDRQRATKRSPLTDIEGVMLAHIITSSLAEEMGQLRDSLELAASQANVETQNDLDWATMIIMTAIRGDNKMSVTVEDEKILKASAGFMLRVDRGEGRTEMEIIKVTTGEI